MRDGPWNWRFRHPRRMDGQRYPGTGLLRSLGRTDGVDPPLLFLGPELPQWMLVRMCARSFMEGNSISICSLATGALFGQALAPDKQE